MSALRTDIRDKMIDLVGALPAIGAANVSPHKLDKVEKANEASVYLNGVDSEPIAMKATRQRSQRINVSLFLQDDVDAVSKGADLLNELEKAVETARRANQFGNLTSCHLENAVFAHDPNSKGKRADVHAAFLFEFSEVLL